MEYEKLMKGLKWIRVALIIIISVSILGTIQTWLFLTWLRSGYYFDNYQTIIPTFNILNRIKDIAMAVSIIFIGIGLFFIRKEPSKISDNHKRNIKWSFIFFWIYAGLYAFQYLFSRYLWAKFETPFMRYIIANVLTNTVSWSIFILFMLVLILPVWIIARKGQRKLLLTYGVGRITMGLIPIFIMLVLILFRFEWLALMFSHPVYYLITGVLSIFFTLCLFWAYHEIIRLLQGKESKSLGRKIKFKIPLGKRFEKGLKKPQYLISLFVIIGLVFGSILGGFIYIENKKWEDRWREDPILDPPSDPEVHIMTTSDSGQLDEGSSYDHVYEMEDSEIISIAIILTWIDENVRAPLQNEPDTFSVVLFVNGTEIDRDSGDHGRISFQAQEGHDESFSSGSFTIQVVCEEAGDIYGPIGVIPRAQDTGNAYDLQVSVEYYASREDTSPEH
jgi:hypothetical protein